MRWRVGRWRMWICLMLFEAGGVLFGERLSWRICSGPGIGKLFVLLYGEALIGFGVADAS